ncbi:MAG: hypothetical protein ACREAB_13000, partial [Blastocatellia bacterium]
PTPAPKGAIRFISINPPPAGKAVGAAPVSLSAETMVNARTEYLFTVEVLDGNNQPIKDKQIKFTKELGAGKFVNEQNESVTTKTDGDGHARMRFEVGELGVPAAMTSPVEITADCADCGAIEVSPATLQLLVVDRSRWRHALEFGSEFNQDLNNQFGSQFFTLGLIGDTHWGKGFHTQFGARLTSVLQRDTLEELNNAVPSTGAAAAPDNLALFFTAKKAFESSLSVFWDDFALFKETRRASDRTRFGPILKYQFRTRIDRQTEAEKADIQKKINDEMDTDRKLQLQDRLAKLNQIAPPSKDVVSEAFVGLRIAHYEKHYRDVCLTDEEAAGDETLEEYKAPQNTTTTRNKKVTEEKCFGSLKPYRRIIDNNSLPKHYFHIMWGGSEHLQNQDRKFIPRRDAQGAPVRDAQNNQIFDLRRGGFTGRVLLEGYMKVPRAPIGLRFNGNLGPGEDEVRFSVFVPIDLSRLGSALKF